ncbi:MAG: M60 family metallopeptidase [Muribaculaceae bacterium]|nr:M60 family metallopeptidase [Muribaculaceae bacterium]
MNKYILSAVVSALTCVTVLAEAPEAGNVYRIKNIGHNIYMTDRGPTSAVGCSTLNEESNAQLWLLEDSPEVSGGLTFRSLVSACYLYSPNAISNEWTVKESVSANNSVFSVTSTNGNFVIRAAKNSGGYNFAHCDASSNVVCWESTATSTQWSFELVEMTQQEIDNALSAPSSMIAEISNASAYQAHLDALFADKACTRLKESGNLASNSHYLALSEPLRRMVDKVQSANWAETNGQWDSEHALKYRVQSYEPFSEGGNAAALAGIQAYTNMNNPTGIVADVHDALYVMVDDAVPAGATLYILGFSDNGMHNSTTEGYELKQGLNIIPNYTDCAHFFIYYTVNTVSDLNGKKVHSEHKVTEFPSLKIHIEGGRLNGFFNPIGDELYRADTRADFDYTSARASHPMYDLVGKYVILHLHKDNVGSSLGVISSLDAAANPGTKKEYDPVEIIKAWDNMCFSERILMGIQSDADVASEYNRGFYAPLTGDNVIDPGFSYADYFNNRMMGISMEGDLYMNATSWRTAYNVSTIASILTELPYGNIWGPAHEYGHINQQPIRIAGTTEESNNIFSNVALYFSPHGTTSRAAYPSDQRNLFNQGKTYLEHGTWGTTRMFWQLWCYYHATGHNPKFYPRLFELLRQDPLDWGPNVDGVYQLNPKNDLLKFAVKCCIAAQEDLTDFFTAWGFFVPQQNYKIGDYANFISNLTPEDIAEVKAEIAALGLPENRAIILIDDRPGSTRPTHDEFNKDLCGEMGGLADFTDGSVPTGNFAYQVSGTTVTISGDGSGGVGFLLYDSEGNLAGFSNSRTFEVSPEVAGKIAAGEITVAVIGSDNSELKASDLVETGSDEDKIAIINNVLQEATALLAYRDINNNRPGMLFDASCDDLQDKVDSTNSALEAGASGNALTDIYQELSAAYYALVNDADATIPVTPGAAYRLVNKAYPTLSMTSDGLNCRTVATGSDDTEVSTGCQWVFEPLGESGRFAIRNRHFGNYIGEVTENEETFPMTETPAAFAIVSPSRAAFAFALDGDESHSLHSKGTGDSRVVRWNATETSTQWELLEVKSADMMQLQERLADAVNSAHALLNTAGTARGYESRPVKITPELLYSNAPHTGNNGSDKFTSWYVILDNNTDTYFHSSWTGGKESADGLNHYIRIEAPEGETFHEFSLTYITRNSNGGASDIKAYVLETSPDGETWAELCSESGLTSGAKQKKVIDGTAPAGTRYLRFMVNESGAQVSETSHYCFAISELSLTNRDENVLETSELYPAVTIEQMQAVIDAIVASAPLRNGNTAPSADELEAAINSITAAADALEAAMTQNHDRLLELIQRTRQLLDETGAIIMVEADGLDLDASLLYSNAPHIGGGDDSTDMSKLIDGNTSTYFHSNYDNSKDSEDGLDHYIRIALPEAAPDERPGALTLSYTTRVSPYAHAIFAPASYTVEITSDMVNWTEALTCTDGLPAGSGQNHSSECLYLMPETKAVRLVVHTSCNDKTAGGHQYFVLSEIGLTAMTPRAEPLAAFSQIDPAVMTDAHTSIHQCLLTLANPTSGESDFQSAMADLQQKYDNLMQARGSMTGITATEADFTDGETTVYDLRGMKLHDATHPGIYIINHRKTIIR